MKHIKFGINSKEVTKCHSEKKDPKTSKNLNLILPLTII